MGSRVLVTGGAGFIGSHTCLVLLEAGYDLLILDNFSNSSPEALTRVAAVANVALDSQRLQIQRGDIRDPITLDELFSAAAASARPFDAVIHFAGLKAVGESVEKPLLYWDVNVSGSRTLLAAMDAHACRTLVFSSSATVYGYPETVPIPESAPVQPINPYGFSKAAVEQMLADLNSSAPNTWRIASLRYFNPVGAHPSGRIGEDPLGIPNNLFPFISQVAVGRREELKIFGSDWPTHDGTGVRDFIHVMDLAEGHKAALETLLSQGPQHLTCNLGSGDGASVLDVVNAFSAASGQDIPYALVDRRPGDAAITVADPTRAARTALDSLGRARAHDSPRSALRDASSACSAANAPCRARRSSLVASSSTRPRRPLRASSRGATTSRSCACPTTPSTRRSHPSLLTARCWAASARASGRGPIATAPTRTLRRSCARGHSSSFSHIEISSILGPLV